MFHSSHGPNTLPLPLTAAERISGAVFLLPVLEPWHCHVSRAVCPGCRQDRGLPWEEASVLRAGKDADGVGGANCQALYSATWRICYPLSRLFSTAVYCWWCCSFFLLADGNGLFLIALISPSASETPHSPADLKVKCTCVGAVSAPLKCEFLQAGGSSCSQPLASWCWRLCCVLELPLGAVSLGGRACSAPCAPCWSCRLRCRAFLDA